MFQVETRLKHGGLKISIESLVLTYVLIISIQ